MKGNMQLFSVDQQRSQALEAHAASFASFKVCLEFIFYMSLLFLLTYDSVVLLYSLCCAVTLSFFFYILINSFEFGSGSRE